MYMQLTCANWQTGRDTYVLMELGKAIIFEKTWCVFEWDTVEMTKEVEMMLVMDASCHITIYFKEVNFAIFRVTWLNEVTCNKRRHWCLQTNSFTPITRTVYWKTWRRPCLIIARKINVLEMCTMFYWREYFYFLNDWIFKDDLSFEVISNNKSSFQLVC